MTDVPADLTTTVTLGQGETYQGTIDTEGDEDWIAITLTAGITYGISEQGEPSGSGTLEDPFIKGLYDADGNSLGYDDDDSGEGRESLLVFTPEVSGTYYVSAGGWDYTTGTYVLSYDVYQAAQANTPTSEPYVEQYENSGNDLVDSLLGLSRYKNLEGGSTVTVSYSIPTTGSVYSDDDFSGYGAQSTDAEPWVGIQYLTSGEAALFEDALAQIASFADIQFEKVDDTATSAGTIRIAWTGLTDEDAAAWAYLPASSVTSGDIWILTENQNTGGEGSYFHLVVIHELGHAVGLKHTFDTDGSGVVMPAEYDGLEYTVMSYNSSVDGADILGLSFYPTSYMYYDILALQYIYGAIEKDTGDTTYTFERGSRYYETIWDTGGTDTYDASSQARNLKLDLTPGSWSNVGTQITMYGEIVNSTKTETIFTPPEITIENAYGGSGNDTIIGNDADNILRGGAGDDTISGGAGNDQIWAGSGDMGDDLAHGGAGDDIVAGGAGDDTLYGDDGADTLYGGSGNDVLYGTDTPANDEGEASSNILWAGAGLDTVYGGAGNDVVGGGADSDVVSGEGGNDVIYGGGSGDDTLSGGQGADTIFGGAGADVLDGGTGSDLIFNGAGADTVNGGGGNDTLWGGGGDDVLTGGSGADVFAFTTTGGTDTVTDFDSSEDFLDLTDAGFADLDAVRSMATLIGSDLHITVGAATVILEGATLADLTTTSVLI